MWASRITQRRFRKKKRPFSGRKPLPRERTGGERRRPAVRLDESDKVEKVIARGGGGPTPGDRRLRDVMALYSTGEIRGIRDTPDSECVRAGEDVLLRTNVTHMIMRMGEVLPSFLSPDVTRRPGDVFHRGVTARIDVFLRRVALRGLPLGKTTRSDVPIDARGDASFATDSAIDKKIITRHRAEKLASGERNPRTSFQTKRSRCCTGRENSFLLRYRIKTTR